MELQVGNNVMRLFSLLYIAASPIHYFSCLLLLMLVVIIYIYIYIYITVSLIFSQLMLKMAEKKSENVAKCSEIGSEKSDILA